MIPDVIYPSAKFVQPPIRLRRALLYREAPDDNRDNAKQIVRRPKVGGLFELSSLSALEIDDRRPRSFFGLPALAR